MVGKFYSKPIFNADNRRWVLMLEVNEAQIYDELKDEELDITIKKHRLKRSLNANALLWECLGRIASELRTDKWEIYLKMLKRYGKYTYICVKPNAVEAVKTQWRECEELGEIMINGEKSMQLICYFGSSTYDSKEFSTLLDGVISEMQEMGINTPSDDELERALEIWTNNGK
jgi:IS1 family transposase